MKDISADVFFSPPTAGSAKKGGVQICTLKGFVGGCGLLAARRGFCEPRYELIVGDTSWPHILFPSP